jgi:uncharacterized protein with ParB-like and HNH nuclease domain
MKDAQKPDHVNLNTLVNYLRDGRFVIPDFQREFEWKPWDIRELMRSIFLDYYIGSLLLWKGKVEKFRRRCLCRQNFVSRQRRLWFEETRFD